MSTREKLRDKLRGDMLSRMHRYPAQGWVSGVCVGLAEYFEWNTKIIRLVFVLALIFCGFFPIGVIYLLLWYLLDADYNSVSSAAGTAQPGISTPAGQCLRSRQIKARFAHLEARLAGMEECVVSKDFELRRELRKLES
ncbi:MAG: PspC domain-containing protein [Stenotrophobium sp.]